MEVQAARLWKGGDNARTRQCDQWATPLSPHIASDSRRQAEIRKPLLSPKNFAQLLQCLPSAQRRKRFEAVAVEFVTSFSLTSFGKMLSFSSFLIPHLILLLTLPTAGRGYPDGAPDMVCVSMEPTGHGAGSQVTDPPYRLMVTRKSYKPGETLQVTLQSIGDNYFRGLMLQARLTGCDVNETQTIGVFTTGDNELQTRHCFGTVHSTVTHNSASRKRMKIVYWTAPVVSSGHVIMTATVVREQQEFWTQVQSHVLSDLEADFPAYCPPTLQPDPPTSHSSSESSLSLPTEPFLTSLPSLTQTTLLVVNQPSDEVMSSPAVVMETEVTQTMDLNDHNLGHKDGGTSEREKSEDAQSLPGWLGTSFDTKKNSASKMDKEQKVPSWLIPALLSAPSNSGHGQGCDMAVSGLTALMLALVMST